MGSYRRSYISPNHYHYVSLLLALHLVFAALLVESGRWVDGGAAVADRKSLIGPGSSPPTCRIKCGRCWPCEPVHVPIQPGLSVPLEYYPEAWRCKCGNKLFMP